MEALLAAGLGALLLAVWLAATRRELRRRRPSAADWDADDSVPRLWTSAARCPDCRATDGVLSTTGDGLWFTCLSCGQRHRRENRA